MNALTEQLTPNHNLARRIIAAGIPVFPCHETGGWAKAPYTANGFKDATQDRKTVDAWWRSWPDAVPGIPTGETSGLSVIDADVNRDTGEALGEAELEALGLDHRSAVRVSTQSGGLHLFFGHVPGATCTAKQVSAHIDTRGNGGYVIAPGAIMADGSKYTYEGRNLATALLAGDLPPFPFQAIQAAIAARKAAHTRDKQSAKDRTAFVIDLGGTEDKTEATDHETLNALRTLLGTAPNDLDRHAWFKLARSLRVGFDDSLRPDFVAFSQRYSGTPCDETAANRMWQSARSPGEITSVAPALALLKCAVGDGRWKSVWRDVFSRRDEVGSDISSSQKTDIAIEPQPLMREVAPGAPYPVASLGLLREAVEAVQGMTQAPVAIPAASALSIASLAVQGFADVETLGGNRAVSLYMLTIAGSGERKSACDAPFMAALRDHEKAEARKHVDETANWNNAYALWKGARDHILTDARKKQGEKHTASQADLEALGRAPVAPPSADRTVTEPTFQGLTKLFAEGLPSLGLFSDEGGQFLGGHAMNTDNRQQTLAAFNDLWQGNPIRRTRAGDGHATLYDRRLAMHLMVQPGVARTFMSDPQAKDMGFLARFLICEPPSTIGTRMHSKARQDDAALAAFRARLSCILETPMPMDAETRELQTRTIGLSSEAKQLLVAFADKTEAHQAKGGDLEHLTGTASKAAEQAARIAGVLTLWRDIGATVVDAEEMSYGIELAEFYLSEASRLAEAANVSREIDQAQSLLDWLSHRWPHPEVTVQDVLQRGPNSLRESPKAKAALKILEDHDWLVPLEAGTNVRGATRSKAWRIAKTPEGSD